MKTLVKWLQEKKTLPYSNYSWTKILGNTRKQFLIRKGCLKFSPNNETVNEVFIDNELCSVEYIQDGYYAIGDECEYSLSTKDVLKLELDPECFAKEISRTIGMKNPIGKGYFNATYLLGDITLKDEYRVFFILGTRRCRDIISDSLGERKPMVIALDNLPEEVEDFVSRKGGECFFIEDVIELGDTSFNLIGKLENISKKPKDTSLGYYSWKGATNSLPEKRTLDILEMELMSSADVMIRFGGKSMKFSYSNISLFRNDKTREPNENWNILLCTALGKNYLKTSETATKKSINRFNTDIRNFFDFPKSITPFSYIDGILRPNFKIYKNNEYFSNRIRSQVFRD